MNIRRDPPYPPVLYDTNIDFLAATPGTPQYRYRHAIGLKYKAWRFWHMVNDFWRSCTTGWWVKIYRLCLVWRLLRSTVSAKFSFEEQRRIDEASPPTQEQLEGSLRVPRFCRRLVTRLEEQAMVSAHGAQSEKSGKIAKHSAGSAGSAHRQA